MVNEASMKKLTSNDIFNIVWTALRTSRLSNEVPTMYADHFPTSTSNNPLTGEFIVVAPLSNAVGDIQVATVNVNIYVPDVTPTIDRSEQRYPNRKRLGELSALAYDALSIYPSNERYYFDVQSETLFSESEFSYSFVNIKVQLKNY